VSNAFTRSVYRVHVRRFWYQRSCNIDLIVKMAPRQPTAAVCDPNCTWGAVQCNWSVEGPPSYNGAEELRHEGLECDSKVDIEIFVVTGFPLWIILLIVPVCYDDLVNRFVHYIIGVTNLHF
jgi:hypothetical protein